MKAATRTWPVTATALGTAMVATAMLASGAKAQATDMWGQPIRLDTGPGAVAPAKREPTGTGAPLWLLTDGESEITVDVLGNPVGTAATGQLQPPERPAEENPVGNLNDWLRSKDFERFRAPSERARKDGESDGTARIAMTDTGRVPNGGEDEPRTKFLPLATERECGWYVRKGETLYETVSRWGYKGGWQIDWQMGDTDIRFGYEHRWDCDLTTVQAMSRLSTTLTNNGTPGAPTIRPHGANRVIVVQEPR